MRWIGHLERMEIERIQIFLSKQKKIVTWWRGDQGGIGTKEIDTKVKEDFKKRNKDDGRVRTAKRKMEGNFKRGQRQ